MKYYLENLFFIFATIFLSPVFYLRIFLRKRKERKTGDGIAEKDLKILVIQTTKIGDMVCTTPVFREIKKNFPNSKISVLLISRTKEILELNPNIDEFIILDSSEYCGFFGRLALIKKIKKENFDWSFNFTPTLFNTILPFWASVLNRAQLASKFVSRGAFLCSLFSNYRYKYKQNMLVLRQYLEMLKFIGIMKYSEEKQIFKTEESDSKAKNFLYREGVKPENLVIGISLSAGNKVKEWDPENFGRLADCLINDLGAKVVFLGSSADKNLAERAKKIMKHNAIDSVGVFSLKELPSLISLLKIFISVDSGPIYIANALDIPVVDIVGPFNISEQLDLDEKCEIVSKKIYCFPCSHIIPTAHGCKEGHRGCVRDIKPQDVYQGVLNLKNRVYGIN